MSGCTARFFDASVVFIEFSVCKVEVCQPNWTINALLYSDTLYVMLCIL